VKTFEGKKKLVQPSFQLCVCQSSNLQYQAQTRVVGLHPWKIVIDELIQGIRPAATE
jgi:hypothetical protein